MRAGMAVGGEGRDAFDAPGAPWSVGSSQGGRDALVMLCEHAACRRSARCEQRGPRAPGRRWRPSYRFETIHGVMDTSATRWVRMYSR